MDLKILLPSRIYAQHAGVARIVAENDAGSFELLPRRLDCVAALRAGILSFTPAAATATVYVAIDQGVLVKCGADVLVSVRRAIGGTDLRSLQAAVRNEFLQFDAREQQVRAAVAKIEAGLIARLTEYEHAR